MACTSCASDKAGTLNDPKWRRALWIALAINGGMFAVEIVAGITGGSKALQADALDFFGDAANYAISLGVAGMAIAWRARAAMLKGATLAVLGLYVLLAAGWGALHSTVPHAEVMGIVGVAALIANLLVAVMLYRFRSGDANMRSVWICSRNDAIGNIAVVLAAGGVFGLNSAWPDLLVAALMAVLGLSGGFQIMRQARAELRSSSTPAPSTYRQPLHGNWKLLRRGPMHRLSALFLCFMLMLSLGLGSVAHATEGVRCVDSTSASSLEHSNGDGDQVPADADKAYPHHHGGCHGHHIGVPFEPNLAASLSGLPMAPVAWSHDPMAPVPSDPALRPPQA